MAQKQLINISGDSVDVGDPWHPLWEMLLESRSELAPYFVDGETEALRRDLSRSEFFLIESEIAWMPSSEKNVLIA